MRQLPAVLCLFALASACDSDHPGPGTPAGPSSTIGSPVPSPSSRALLPAAQQINVGEEVNNTLTVHGERKVYDLTALSDGTLVVHLSWDPQKGRVELEIGETHWAGEGAIVAKLPVVIGGHYSLIVGDGAPWDYDVLHLPFVMTTSIERSQVSPALFELVARHSQKCLDVAGWSAADGTPLSQWACHGGDNQIWSLDPAADGSSRIVSRHSGKCLDVNGASTDDGAQVIQWQCHGGANQQWRLEAVTGGYRILARHSVKCLDVSGESRDDGASITQWQCHGGANQTWLLRSVTAGLSRQ